MEKIMLFECECGERFEMPDNKPIRNRRRLAHPEQDMEDDYLEFCPFCRAVERFHEVEEADDE